MWELVFSLIGLVVGFLLYLLVSSFIVLIGYFLLFRRTSKTSHKIALLIVRPFADLLVFICVVALAGRVAPDSLDPTGFIVQETMVGFVPSAPLGIIIDFIGGAIGAVLFALGVARFDWRKQPPNLPPH